jgi:hypothetical protein
MKGGIMQPTKRIRTRFSGTIFGLKLLTTVICGSPNPARAVGIGPYFEFSGGSGEFEWDRSNIEFDVDVGTGSVGLVIDSAPTGGSFFNYRFNIGYERQDLEDDFNTTMELDGLVIENIFGFAVVNQPNMRWWIGPLLRFGFYSGETDAYLDSFGELNRTETDLFEFGIGAAAGINMRVARNLVLAPSAGIRFIGASGEGTVVNYDAGTRIDEDLTGSFSTVFINFALLFE